MKKKGFTLVELLAVIVILAVILLIAVPKIGDVIYSSRKNTFKNSAYALLSTAEKLYQESYAGSLSEESVLYDIENGKVLQDGVEVAIVEGKIDGKGFIQIDFEGDSKIALENDEFCAVKQFNDAEVIVSDKEEGTQCGKIYISFSYELNGGTPAQDFETSYLENTKITLLEPTKENSKFVNWEVIKGNSIIKDNVLTIGGKDTTIYAVWENLPTLTLDLNGGTIENNFGGVYKSGTTIETIKPTKEGYAFSGWVVSSGNGVVSGNIFTMGSSNTTIKATWRINTYQINYNLDGGTLGTNAPTSGTYGSTIVVSKPIKPGHTFTEWTVEGTDASINDTNLTIGISDITLTANWTINTYTITYNLDGGTFANEMPTQAEYGTTIILETPTKEGYAFASWTVSGNNAILGVNNLTIGDGNVVLTAEWISNSLIESYSCSNTSKGPEPYKFTYTGNCEVVDDGNNNWRVKFLTSGEFTPNISANIELFLVGGGGGGGTGGGSTRAVACGGAGGKTLTEHTVIVNTITYAIEIGTGGAAGSNDSAGKQGDTTTAFGFSAIGGTGGGGYNSQTGGGTGGSAGGEYAEAGGSYGASEDGKGQGITTCEFGEGTTIGCQSGVNAYSGGGGGSIDNTTTAGGAGGGGNGGHYSAGNGVDNTGGGGGATSAGTSTTAGKGGSGIVIIRNFRSTS